MHGLTGGSWKRNHDQTTATEKNDPGGKQPGPSGSLAYRRSRSPRQLSTLHAVWARRCAVNGEWCSEL
jgi:hypothetical protein